MIVCALLLMQITASFYYTLSFHRSKYLCTFRAFHFLSIFWALLRVDFSCCILASVSEQESCFVFRPVCGAVVCILKSVPCVRTVFHTLFKNLYCKSSYFHNLFVCNSLPIEALHASTIFFYVHWYRMFYQ